MTFGNNEFNDDPYKAKILVVDDEAPNIKLLEELFKMSGYSNVSSTQESADVLELYKQHQFDLILMDLNMPGLDGYDVLKQLKTYTNNNLPAVLMITAQHIESYLQKALDEGARDYVTKPFNFDDLLSRVYKILESEFANKNK